MNLLEIKNNLVKIAYATAETPVLGRFAVISSSEKSYVAQFVNLKSDITSSYAIAKLLFTFSQDGVVNNYDGSIPEITSDVSFLSAQELLDLLPIETPIKIGNLAQQDSMLYLDVSVFERNLAIFVEKDIYKNQFISNCVRQLFQLRERSVIVDTCNIFEDYPKIEISKDFKLPLNSRMIDYIFEYELQNVDPTIKSVVQEIFYEVQQYIKTLENEFIPINSFVDVVAAQYRQTQMPELALLKNKLQKYRDAGIFADSLEEITVLKEQLSTKNCTIIDLKSIHETLQKEVISYVHATLNSIEKYVYYFVPLTDENSDKQLLRQLINNNHVFTAMFASSSYKYASELREHSQNMLLFTPKEPVNDLSAYNTFLNKLNDNECVVVGNLTQGIPFIVEMNDLNLDIKKDDVLGDKVQFFPQIEEEPVQPVVEQTVEPVEEVLEPEEEVEEAPEEIQVAAVEPVLETETHVSAIAPLKNILANDEDEDVVIEEMSKEEFEEELIPQDLPEVEEPVIEQEEEVVEETFVPEELPQEEELSISDELIEEDVSVDFEEEVEQADNSEEDDDLSFMDEIDEIGADEEEFQEEEIEMSEDLSEEDSELLDEIDLSELQEGPVPTVPIYPADEDNISEEDFEGMDYNQGDSVTHPRYGRGVVEKIIKYGNKTLCSITFENVGRRLLDPTISELTKL